MTKIFKYPIPMKGVGSVLAFPEKKFSLMLSGYPSPRVLKVACIGDDPFIWATHDDIWKPVERNFLILATGEAWPNIPLRYIGTFFQFETYVWHLFEEIVADTSGKVCEVCKN